MNHLIFVREAYIPNFRPLVPFLHVKKFVGVGGGGCWVGGWVGVKTWILVLSFKPKLHKIIRVQKILDQKVLFSKKQDKCYQDKF